MVSRKRSSNSSCIGRNQSPKKSKFGPKMAFLFILGQALPAHLVGGCGARAVSRKTPIYFILIIFTILVIGVDDRASSSSQEGMIEQYHPNNLHNLPQFFYLKYLHNLDHSRG